MKCPLKRSKYVWPSGQEECLFEDCLKEECAWWDNREDMCNVTTLADKITDMRDTFIQIRDKMPHAGQFTK